MVAAEEEEEGDLCLTEEKKIQILIQFNLHLFKKMKKPQDSHFPHFS